jgi:hypothetical protein
VLRATHEIALPPVERAGLEHHMVAVRSALSEKAFAAAWAEGQATPLDQVLAEALPEAPVG